MDNDTPVALIGPGGAGKSSLALEVLHHERTKQKFGDERRFMGCDKIQVSCAHFLDRLSQVVGAGARNPQDTLNLETLRPHLSSKSIFLVLDNAESVLDTGANDAGDIYGVIDDLIQQFPKLYILITSRVSTLPPVKHREVPSLPRDAASETFLSIRGVETISADIEGVLEELEFHALSIYLLATVALQSRWDDDRLAREWKKRRTGILANKHRNSNPSNSLAATINLSLNSPMFVAWGADARGVLEVIAFFPHGVDEKKLEWVFPTVTSIRDIIDTFYILSLTYRTSGFVTMLAPLRDYLLPRDPCSAPLLLTTKAQYFARLDLLTEPPSDDDPGFSEAQQIDSDDTDVEDDRVHRLLIGVRPSDIARPDPIAESPRDDDTGFSEAQGIGSEDTCLNACLTLREPKIARPDLITENPRDDDPRFSEARWILAEDTNVEHLLDTFTSLDPDSADVWRACHKYILYLIHLNPHTTTLEWRIKSLPDSHPWKEEGRRLLRKLGLGTMIQFIPGKGFIDLPLIIPPHTAREVAMRRRT